MIYAYGVGLGIESLLHGRAFLASLKHLVVPVNYWRTLEYKLVFDALQPASTDRILDIGSPKLLSFYLADRIGAEVYATDINDYFLRNYESFASLRNLSLSRYHPMVADGRSLPFPDRHFTKVFSISVVEHIPENGDALCLAEIARVLAPGGCCVLTVPFSPVGTEEHRRDNEFYWAVNTRTSVPAQSGEEIFFQRRYDEETLYSRLIAPSGLEVEKIMYLGESVHLAGTTELGRYFHPLLGPFHPILSHLFHASPSPSWKTMVNPRGALMVLAKPPAGGSGQ